VQSTFGFALIRHHYPYNLALRSSLVRVHGLRVNLQRDPAVGVPQELLDRLHIFPVRPQQRAECFSGLASHLSLYPVGDVYLAEAPQFSNVYAPELASSS
jgi:hypothetical protein